MRLKEKREERLVAACTYSPIQLKLKLRDCRVRGGKDDLGSVVQITDTQDDLAMFHGAHGCRGL